MLSRNAANTDRENTHGNQPNHRQNDEKILRGADRGGPLRLDIELEMNDVERLTLGELFLPLLDRRDEIRALLERLTHAGEHVKLHGRGDDAGDDEHEYDRRRDEEKFTVESHSHN